MPAGADAWVMTSSPAGCRRRRADRLPFVSPASHRSAPVLTCYGRSLATGKRVDIGEAVGIIAAQSMSPAPN